MKKTLLIILYLHFVTISLFPNSNLRDDFKDPPFEYGPWVFWMWMNGNISKEGIKLDLEAMSNNGISGAVLFTSNAGLPSGHLLYGSDEWFEYNKYTFEEAKTFKHAYNAS